MPRMRMDSRMLRKTSHLLVTKLLMDMDKDIGNKGRVHGREGVSLLVEYDWLIERGGRQCKQA